MVGGNGGAPVVHAPRWRGPKCGLTNAGIGPGKIGRPIERSLGILQLSRDTGCVPAAIRERDSPTGSVSGYVRHRAGSPCSARIWGHGQACP